MQNLLLAVKNILGFLTRNIELSNERVYLVGTPGEGETVAEAFAEVFRTRFDFPTLVDIWDMPRPYQTLPPNFTNMVINFGPTISVYCGTGVNGEISVRKQMGDLFTGGGISPKVKSVNKGGGPVLGSNPSGALHCRHLHMPEVTPEQIMLFGELPFGLLWPTLAEVEYKLRRNKILRFMSPYSDITFTITEPGKRLWFHDICLPAPGDYNNIPFGEINTANGGFSDYGFRADGRLRVSICGDGLDRKHGFVDKPVTVTIENSRVVDVVGEHPLAADLMKSMLNPKDPSGGIISELGISLWQFILTQAQMQKILTHPAAKSLIMLEKLVTHVAGGPYRGCPDDQTTCGAGSQRIGEGFFAHNDMIDLTITCEQDIVPDKIGVGFFPPQAEQVKINFA